MQTLSAVPAQEWGEISGEWPHLAALRVCSAGSEDEAAADWFAACRRLTSRVERTGRWSALLDLGICTDAEAVAALDGLLEWLAASGFRRVAGIAPSAALAQLAQTCCTPQRPLAILSPTETTAFLKRVPVAALLHLHPRGLVTPEVVERLRRYGLHTLGHVARIGELALRRQFGATGSFLAALAQGRDARPLCPMPLPPELRIRARFATPVTFEELLASLPRLAERAAERLRAQGRRARALQLVVRWESGAVQRSRLTLRQYSDSPMLLAQELQRAMALVKMSGRQPATEVAPEWPAATKSAFADSSPPADARGRMSADFSPSVPWVPASTPSHHSASEITSWDGIEELRLTLSDFAPAAPDQATFWRTRAQQAAAVEQVAETLERRHGRPLLLRPQLATPSAIFSEERYRFTPPDVALPSAASPDALRSHPHSGVTDMRASRMRPKRLAQADVAEIGDVGGASTGDGDDAWRDVPQRVHWW